MTREEAIALLNEQYETCKRIYDCSADQRKSYPNVPQFMEALDMALTALRSMQEVGEPLSLEQLKQMDGKPVWIEDTSCWGLVFIPKAGQFKNSPFVMFRKEGVQFEWHVTDSELTIYSYPPAHIDRSEWAGKWKDVPFALFEKNGERFEWNVEDCTSELRPCFVKDRKALFHRWEPKMQVVGESALRGGHTAGQLAATFGIVEYEDGTVRECYPQEIRFCDNKLEEYHFPVSPKED